MIKYLFVVILSLAAPTAFGSEQLYLKSASGQIEVLIDKPVGQGKHPVIVFAPGSSYSMREPLFVTLAERLSSRNITVIRFNWAYLVKDPVNGKQSPDREAEIEDLRAVLSYLMSQGWVDSSQVFLGGKSLGSIIAWRTAEADTNIKATVLLTPVCTKADTPSLIPLNYPGIELSALPSLWVWGDDDPVCKTSDIYPFLSRIKTKTRISVLSGNHIFASQDTREQYQERLNLVSDIVADFILSQARSSSH